MHRVASPLLRCLYRFGLSYENLGLIPSAIEVLDIAINLEPYNLGALNNLGVIYSKIGNHKKAIELLSKASEFAPNELAVLFSLAKAYEQDNNLIKAAELYRKVKDSTKDYRLKVLAQGALRRIKN